MQADIAARYAVQHDPRLSNNSPYYVVPPDQIPLEPPGHPQALHGLIVIFTAEVALGAVLVSNENDG